MGFIADVMLGAGALGAAIYCYVLARRLRKFTDLEKGVGGAVALLAMQVDDLSKTLKTAQSAATDAQTRLSDQGSRAEASAVRLELLLAAMHDFPEPAQQTVATASAFYQRQPAHGPA